MITNKEKIPSKSSMDRARLTVDNNVNINLYLNVSNGISEHFGALK